MRTTAHRALLLSAVLFACDGGTDQTTDAGQTDTGTDTTKDASQDTGVDDSGADPDAGDADGGQETDGGPDGGMTMPGVSLRPGSGVTIEQVAIEIGTDSFASVNTKLAAATRTRITGDTSRSYTYSFNSGASATIWFANSNLDLDDQPPNDVDDDDRVLWIAVEDGFPGTTADDVGVDSTQTEVEAAYGAPPHTVAVANPQGTVAQYYTQGLLVAYEPNGDVRTITICRRYEKAPDGDIDVHGARIQLGGDELKGFVALGDLGTDVADVRTLLGEPDAACPNDQACVALGGQDFKTISYGFIGIEVFYLQSATAFFTLHAPYYGTTPGGEVGLGSTKTDMETYLTGEGYTVMASSTPQLVCYTHATDPDIGVTYNQTDIASSITIPLLQCP